jgi:pilus assembly protein CpaC
MESRITRRAGLFAARSWLPCALALMLGLAGAAQAQSPADPAPRDILLAPGESQVVNTEFPIGNIIVGADTVATAVPLSRTSFVLQTRAPGRTAIVALDEAQVRRQQFNVTVRDDFSGLSDILNGLDGGNQISVTNVNGRVLLRGQVRDENQRQKALDVAASFSTATVIDSLRVVDSRQVMLRVNILELSRSSGTDLGVSLFGSSDAFVNASGTPFESRSGTRRITSALLGDFDVDYVLQALEVKGLARRLANPTLVTVNGEEASFVVGGEVPIVAPVTDSTGSTTGDTQTDYREYGVRLNFTPTIMDRGVVRLVITPEVSQIDDSVRVDDNPSFITRRVTTTVELDSGNSFVIAGLLQSNSERAIAQFPWLGNLPIIGALFRSSSFQNNETELVVIVTPVLVNTRSPQVQPYDPRNQSSEPTQSEFFLLGLVESTRGLSERFRAGIGANGPFGHILPGE